MIEPINVLSCFDGMSCGQLAMARAEIPVANYYASEIDKHAMKVTMANFPGTQYVGDVRELDPEILPMINILIGGSPCQSLSFAGKRNGMSANNRQPTTDNRQPTTVETESIEILTLEHYLQLKEEKFEYEGESYLFWEFIRILKALKKKNPEIKFLLENVMMGEKWQRIFTRAIGINPICINSALLSAQNRERLYWTNIGAKPFGFFGDIHCAIPQPKDQGIVLDDILEDEVDIKYQLSETAIARINRKKGFLPKIDPVKAGTLNTKNNSGQVSFDSGTVLISDRGSGGSFVYSTKGKVGALSSRNGCSHDNAVMRVGVVNDRGELRETEKSTAIDANYHKGMDNHAQRTLIVHNTVSRTGGKKRGGTGPLSRTDGKTYGLNTEGKLNAVEIKREVIQLNESGESGGKQPYQQNRIYDSQGISPALCADKANYIINIESFLRRLTPRECERLQTVPDDYTAHVSDTQRYRMLGNGWTIDVIVWILSFYGG